MTKYKKKGRNILQCTTDNCPLTAITFQKYFSQIILQLFGVLTQNIYHGPSNNHERMHDSLQQSNRDVILGNLANFSVASLSVFSPFSYH